MTPRAKGASRGVTRIHNVWLGVHARTLIDSATYERGIDREIRDALGSLTDSLNVAYMICQYGVEERQLYYEANNSDPYDSNTAETALRGFNSHTTAGFGAQIDVCESGDLRGLLVPLETRQRDEYGRQVEKETKNFIFYGAYKDNSLKYLKELMARVRFRSDIDTISRIVTAVLNRRGIIYSRFPQKFSDAYWDTAELEGAAQRRAPWDQATEERDPGDGPLRKVLGRCSTVTLSFDLRRSTRAMERMIDKKAYADWIEGMVLILRRITIENNGIFDKFTGDGALAHFLEDECRDFRLERDALKNFNPDALEGAAWRSRESSGGHYAATDALACAFEMITAVKQHALRLAKISRKFDKNFGPVVGIAKDVVQWSVNRDGDPIVVGAGVVDACRFADGAAKGEVRISPHLHELLIEAGVTGRAKIKSHRSKETGDGDVERVWRYKRAPEGLRRSDAEIRDIVEEIQHELDQRGRRP